MMIMSGSYNWILADWEYLCASIDNYQLNNRSIINRIPTMTGSISIKNSNQAALNVNTFEEARNEIARLLQVCQEIVTNQDQVDQLIQRKDKDLDFKEGIVQENLARAQEYLRWLDNFHGIYEERLRLARDVQDNNVNSQLHKLIEFAKSKGKDALRFELENTVTNLGIMQAEIQFERGIGIQQAQPQELGELGHPTIGKEDQLPINAPMDQVSEDLVMTNAQQRNEDLVMTNAHEHQRATVMEMSSQVANQHHNGNPINLSPMESPILAFLQEEVGTAARNQARIVSSARDERQLGIPQGKPVNTSTPRIHGDFNGFDSRLVDEPNPREIRDSRVSQGEQARTFVRFPASQIPGRISNPKQANLTRPNFDITTSPESHQVPWENFENQNYHQNSNPNFNQVQNFQNFQQNFNQYSNLQNFNEFQGYPQNFNQFQSYGENWNGPARNASLGFNNFQNYGQSFQDQDPRMYRPNYWDNQDIVGLDTRHQSRGVELQNANGNLSNPNYPNFQNSNLFNNLNPNCRTFGNQNLENSYPQPSFNISRIHDGNASRSNEIRFKLQKLKLPEFDGDEMKFTAFLQSFDVFIGQDPSRTDLEKLMFLKQCCKGKAAQVLDNYPAAPGFYNLARSALSNRFAMGRDGPQRVWMKLERISNCDLKPDQLSETIDKIKNAIFQLQYLGEKVDGISIETTILRKFPDKIRHRLKNISTPHLVPTGSTTLDLLSRLDYVVNEYQRDREFEKDRLLSAKYSSRCIDANVASCDGTKNSNEKIDYEKKNKSNIKPASRTKNSEDEQKEDNPVECLYCKSTEHSLFYCKLSFEARRKKAMEDGRCMNCLKLDHATESCEVRYCRVDNESHHESMCEYAIFVHEGFKMFHENPEEFAKLAENPEEFRERFGKFFRGQH
ncbi:unnamed protein product [Caenorhabditis angaria]|uniref:Uncharacterized protein n=1 Tax=Caenorhabditis angaria TaxID=860376 RepID=A0A9P1N9M7_9PELO|nr:unnamed protein product [Caenorhabditis angaria]